MDPRVAALALVLGFSTSAFAQPPNMRVAEYMTRKKQINAEYVTAQAACNAPGARSREICLAEALGKEHVAKADLEVDYRSTPRTQLEASEARADATFWLARERCGDVAYPLQERCVQDAKAAEIVTKAQAKERSRAAQAKLLAEEDRALARALADPGKNRSHDISAK
jgi:hypothetical protein